SRCGSSRWRRPTGARSAACPPGPGRRRSPGSGADACRRGTGNRAWPAARWAGRSLDAAGSGAARGPRAAAGRSDRISASFAVRPLVLRPRPAGRLEGHELQLSPLSAAEHLDLALRLVELAGAVARQAHALLEQAQRGLQRQVASLQVLHDPLEAQKRVLEARFLAALATAC